MTQNNNSYVVRILVGVFSPVVVFIGGLFFALITPKSYCNGSVSMDSLIPPFIKWIYEVTHEHNIWLLNKLGVTVYFGMFCMALVVVSGLLGTFGLKLLPTTVNHNALKKVLVGGLCVAESIGYTFLYDVWWKLETTTAEKLMRFQLALLVLACFHLVLFLNADYIRFPFIILVSIIMFALLSYVFAFFLYRTFAFIVILPAVGGILEALSEMPIFIIYRD